jgi:hypothetical protein
MSNDAFGLNGMYLIKSWFWTGCDGRMLFLDAMDLIGISWFLDLVGRRSELKYPRYLFGLKSGTPLTFRENVLLSKKSTKITKKLLNCQKSPKVGKSGFKGPFTPAFKIARRTTFAATD